MEREIKFRGYHKGKGMFDVYGFNKKFVFKNDLNSPEPMENIFPIEDCILMQFTGLSDKNGVHIYDGDIITEPRVLNNDEYVGLIKYDTDLAAFIIEKSNGGFDYIGNHFLLNKTHQVGGNIHENPELLK